LARRVENQSPTTQPRASSHPISPAAPPFAPRPHSAIANSRDPTRDRTPWNSISTPTESGRERTGTRNFDRPELRQAMLWLAPRPQYIPSYLTDDRKVWTREKKFMQRRNTSWTANPGGQPEGHPSGTRTAGGDRAQASWRNTLEAEEVTYRTRSQSQHLTAQGKGTKLL